MKKTLKQSVLFPKKILYRLTHISKKLKVPEKEASRDWISEKKGDAGSIFKRSTRKFSHYAILSIFLVVIVVGILTRPGNVKDDKNPYLFSRVNEEVNEVTYVQSVATIGSIVDDEIGQKTYEIAAKKNTAPVLAVAGNGFIAKPTLAESRDSEGKVDNTVKEYVVQNGDTLSTIANQFGLTTDTLRWANGIENPDSVKPGDKLLIPPVIGVLYTVQEGDTLDSIATAFSGTKSMIIAQNDLYGEDIKPGMRIMIPDGVGPELPQPAPEPESEEDYYTPQPRTRVASYSGSSYNRFPYGWCTYYVASRRNVPWSGNAGDWYWNAQSAGYSVGRAPAPGAIMVTGESGWGHVAYVESVNGNTFTVSEMNYNGWGVVSSRTITTSSVPLYGFIY